MNIDKMISTLEKQGGRKTNPFIYETVLYYYGSIVLNMYNYRKEKEGNDRFIKFYGMVLANSGSGKSFAIKMCEGLFPKLINYKDNCRAAYTNFYNGNSTDDRYKFMPTATNSLEGTKEGLFKIADAQANCGYGSLNLISEEIGDVASGSYELLSKLKELYDGKYRAKIVKGSRDDDREEDIDSIICNVLMLGSDDGVSSETRKQLEALSKSGLYRRSFIFDIEPEDVIENEQSYAKEEYALLRMYFNTLLAERASSFNPTSENFISSTDGFKMRLKDINKFLVDQYNSDKYNKQYGVDLGALTAIENLAYVIAFLEYRLEVEKEDLDRAFEFYKKSRASTEETFNPSKPYNLMYKLLKRGNPLSITEMIEIDNTIPQNKNQITDQVNLLDEKCYRNNEQLISSGGKITRYSIEPLPITDNSKIKISVCVDNKWEKSVLFAQVEVPFFHQENVSTLESLIKSDVQSFTTAWFKEKGAGDYGYRGKDYFISGQNLIAFDIDEGITIEEAMNILVQYNYILYTTKSHQKDKNGIICDRFRVLLPTKTEFYVDAEQHKAMYENLSELLGFTTYDKATRNVSRLWYTNKNATIYTNFGSNIDITSCIPDTDKSEHIMPKVIEVNREIDEGNLDKRIAGFYKWFIANTAEGNRNQHLYHAAKFFEEIGEDKEYHVRYLNNMLANPLSENNLTML